MARSAKKQVSIIDHDAAEIGELYERGAQCLVDAVVARLECGRRLAEKKKELGHGAWLPWLEANRASLGFGESAAKMMMRAAVDFDERQLAADLDEALAITISRSMWGHQQAIDAGARSRKSEEDEPPPKPERPKTHVHAMFDEPVVDVEEMTDEEIEEQEADERAEGLVAEISCLASDCERTSPERAAARVPTMEIAATKEEVRAIRKWLDAFTAALGTQARKVV